MKNRKLFALTSLATVSLATIVGCAKENLNTAPVNTAEPVASVSALSDADVENAMFDLVDLPAKEESDKDEEKDEKAEMIALGLYVDNDETILTEEEKARRRQTATSNNTKTGSESQSSGKTMTDAEAQAFFDSFGKDKSTRTKTNIFTGSGIKIE